MTGASAHTKRVAYVSGNWTAGADGAPGAFALQVVTEDGARHALDVAAPEMAPLLALVQASDVLLWDGPAATLIAPNLAGEWMQRSWSSGERRRAGRPH